MLHSVQTNAKQAKKKLYQRHRLCTACQANSIKKPQKKKKQKQKTKTKNKKNNNKKQSKNKNKGKKNNNNNKSVNQKQRRSCRRAGRHAGQAARTHTKIQ